MFLRFATVLRHTSLLAAAMMLGGCLAPPRQDRPALPSFDAALQSRAGVVSADPPLAGDKVPAEWWQLLGDPTLSALQDASCSWQQ